MKCIIFDLDLTLIDTTCLEDLRHLRNWPEVYKKIPQTKIYPGIKDVLALLKLHNYKIAIVSTSPRLYIEKILQYYNIPINIIVSYHDAKFIKPHPAQMLKALELMGEDAKNAISFGDRVIDIQASNAACVESVACFWGTKEKSKLMNSNYSHAIIHPNEILTLVR